MTRELRYANVVGSPRIRVEFLAPVGTRTLKPGDALEIDAGNYALMKDDRRFEFSDEIDPTKSEPVTMAQKLMAEVENRPPAKPKRRKPKKEAK